MPHDGEGMLTLPQAMDPASAVHSEHEVVSFRWVKELTLSCLLGEVPLLTEVNVWRR